MNRLLPFLFALLTANLALADATNSDLKPYKKAGAVAPLSATNLTLSTNVVTMSIPDLSLRLTNDATNMIFSTNKLADKSYSYPSIYDRTFNKTDLPTGGEFLVHPKKAMVHYYFTNRQRMWEDKNIGASGFVGGFYTGPALISR